MRITFFPLSLARSVHRLAHSFTPQPACKSGACFYSWQFRFERATQSLATFVRSHRSLAPQRSTLLCLLHSPARSVHRLAHSLRSLSLGTVEIHESVFMLRSRLKETNAIVVVTTNTPWVTPKFLWINRNKRLSKERDSYIYWLNECLLVMRITFFSSSHPCKLTSLIPLLVPDKLTSVIATLPPSTAMTMRREKEEGSLKLDS